jgi:hypothetical protein
LLIFVKSASNESVDSISPWLEKSHYFLIYITHGKPKI